MKPSRVLGNTGRWLISRGFLAGLIDPHTETISEVRCAIIRDVLTDTERTVYVSQGGRWGIELDAAIAAAQFEMEQLRVSRNEKGKP